MRVTRDTDAARDRGPQRHPQLRGDFEAVPHRGRQQPGGRDRHPEEHRLRVRQASTASARRSSSCCTLGRHFVGEFPWVTGGRWAAEQYAWERIDGDGDRHDHSFVRTGRETRTAVVQIDGDETRRRRGLTDCAVLKTTGSEFHGFPRDRYTTLAETDRPDPGHRVTASWRYTGDGIDDLDFNALYDGIRDRCSTTFAGCTRWRCSRRSSRWARPCWRGSPRSPRSGSRCPNKHHFLVDLEPFGLDNPGEVFFAADRPYGLIEATVAARGRAGSRQRWPRRRLLLTCGSTRVDHRAAARCWSTTALSGPART